MPEIVREDDDRTGAGSRIIRLVDNTAQSRADAEDREIAAGDDFGSNGFRIAARREIHIDFGAAEDAVGESGLLLEVAADGVGHEVPGAESADGLIAVPIDKDEAARVADRQTCRMT